MPLLIQFLALTQLTIDQKEIFKKYPQLNAWHFSINMAVLTVASLFIINGYTSSVLPTIKLLVKLPAYRLTYVPTQVFFLPFPFFGIVLSMVGAGGWGRFEFAFFGFERSGANK